MLLEVLQAVLQRKPIIVVRETEDAHGADTFASLRKRRHASDSPWVTVHHSVRGGESKADSDPTQKGASDLENKKDSDSRPDSDPARQQSAGGATQGEKTPGTTSGKEA